jgi:hypothetical protein
MRSRLLLALLVAPLAALSDPVHGQVTVDLRKRTLSGEMPYNQTFAIVGEIPHGTNAPVPVVRFRYGRATGSAPNEWIEYTDTATRDVRSPLIPPGSFRFDVGPLSHRQRYGFEFALCTVVWRKGSVPSSEIPSQPEREACGDTSPLNDSTYPRIVRDEIRLFASPDYSLVDHFDQDLGVLHGLKLGHTALMTSVHFYVRPVNADEDRHSMTALQKFTSDVSVFGGLAIREIHSQESTKGYFDQGSPIFGVGARLPGARRVRFLTGVVFLKQAEANPLVTRDVVKRDLFLSLTGDVSVRGLITPLANILGI